MAKNPIHIIVDDSNQLSELIKIIGWCVTNFGNPQKSPIVNGFSDMNKTLQWPAKITTGWTTDREHFTSLRKKMQRCSCCDGES